MRLSFRCFPLALLALRVLPLQAATRLVNAHVHAMDPARRASTVMQPR